MVWLFVCEEGGREEEFVGENSQGGKGGVVVGWW